MATVKTMSENAQPAPTETPRNAETLPETLIEAGRQRWADELKEIWMRRELLYFLIWRDIKVRYRDTFLSAGWALVQPAVLTVIFTVFMGPHFASKSTQYPYPLFVYSGFLAWNFFSTSITGASMSVVNSEALIGKVYFPRLILPLATVGTNLADLFIASFGLVGLMLYYQVAPGWSLLLLPVWVILCALAGVGVGTLLAALNVRYRDFRFVVPHLMQAWMFSTPAIFAPPPAAKEPDTSTATIFGSHELYQRLYETIGWMNPVNSLIFSFRNVALGGEAPWNALVDLGPS